MSALLEVKGLTKSFGRLAAIVDVSMNVEQGEIRAIIGPNGAGKTTFFNLITGVIKPDAGSIVFDGHPIIRLPVHRRIGLGMSRTFQVPNIFGGLSVHENLRLGVEASLGLSRSPWPGRAATERVETRVE